MVEPWLERKLKHDPSPTGLQTNLTGKIPTIARMARRRSDPQSDVTPLEAMTDEQLIGSHLAGRDQAFETLIQRYNSELFNFLMKFSGQRAAADDLFQETFLQVYLSAETFDLSKRFKPWLFTIGANKARDYLRRNKRRRAASLSATTDGDEDSMAFVDMMQADIAMPQENVQNQETRHQVQEIIEEMPDHLREVLVFSYFEKMPYKDIADMLQIPLGTVKSRLHAAVGTFAKLWMARHGDEKPPDHF